MGKGFQFAFVSLAALLGIWLVGCSNSSETAQRDTLTSNVGQYPAGPAGVNRPRVGVPPLSVSTDNGGSSDTVEANAADILTTLLDQTDRFAVIERAQLNQLIKEQSLEGIVKGAELAKMGQVRGVDFLVLAKVTNLRVKQEKTSNTFGLGQIGGGELGSVGGAAVANAEVTVTTECGVDIRFVDPTSGELMTSNFSEFTRTDKANSMGLTLLGANASSGAEIQVSDDDKGKILRLALDDAIRKSLPKIDRWLQSQPPKPAPAANTNMVPPAAVTH